MKLITTEEINNTLELEKVLEEKNMKIEDYKVCVISIIKNKNDKFIMQRRGEGARDEVGLLEHVGGCAEYSDPSYRFALIREITEEAGTNIHFKIEDFVGCFYETKYDKENEKNQNWIFLLYASRLISGKLSIEERKKCAGYEAYEYEDIPSTDCSESCNYFNKYYNEKTKKLVNDLKS